MDSITQRPGRSRPTDPEELPSDDFGAPPLHGKVHPHDMHFIVPSVDDGRHPHHPNEPLAAEFDVDPDNGDAAADLAGDLGAQFLEGITYGEDMSERVLEDAEAQENEIPFLVEDLSARFPTLSADDVERRATGKSDGARTSSPSRKPRRTSRRPAQ